MKILYIPCHVILEYDQIRIFDQLGYDCTVIGGYIDPNNPHVDMRPPLNIKYNPTRVNKIHILYEMNLRNGIPKERCSSILTKEIVDDYDCIFIDHRIELLDLNWDVIKHKIVILRTIGQSLPLNELKLKSYINKGLKILRYSPKERELRNYAGEHGLIRFLKYSSDFKPRNVIKNKVISFGQSVPIRGNSCGSYIIESVSKKLPFTLFGPGNESYLFSGGKLSYENQLIEYATNNCYLYTGTFPAQYTLNFVEAMLSGIPIVSIGRKLSQRLIHGYPFEVPDILDEVSGYYFDNIDDISNKLNGLLVDIELTNKTSNKQIEIGRKFFSVENNISQWGEFFNNL